MAVLQMTEYPNSIFKKALQTTVQAQQQCTAVKLVVTTPVLNTYVMGLQFTDTIVCSDISL